MAGSRSANKLQIKPGKTLVVLGAPPGYRQALGSLPQEVRLSTSLRGKAGVVQAVFRTRKDLLARVPSLKRGLGDGGILWICYPKLTASAAGELNRDVIWKALEPLGLARWRSMKPCPPCVSRSWADASAPTRLRGACGEVAPGENRNRILATRPWTVSTARTLE